MRIFTCLCLLLLSGCAARMPSPSIPHDQQLFFQGLQEVNSRKGLPPAFVALQKTYPESSWSDKAEVIKELLGTLKTQQETIARLQRDQLSCRQGKEALRQKHDSLEEDLKKIKQLMIDLEKRGG